MTSSRVVERSIRRTTRALVACMIGGTLGLSSELASAEIPIAKAKGWELSTDGRLNTFLMYAFGKAIPQGEQTYTGVDETANTQGNIVSSRVRTGFVTSVLGFNLKKQVTEHTTVSGRVGMWMLVSSQKTNQSLAPDMREVYLKIEGPAGGLLAGRNLSLFGRGAIGLNYEIGQNYGLGHPCAIRSVGGGACGHAGFGILFPGFNAGIVYNTPDAAGLQLSVGLYDPSILESADYKRTPYPRVESEVTYHAGKTFNAFVGGLWQRLERTKSPTSTPANPTPGPEDSANNALGVSYGLGINVGPLQLGGSGYYGKGLGTYVPLENNPTVTEGETGDLRLTNGYFGQGALTFGDTKVAAGFGVSRVTKSPGDPGETGGVNLMKQQLGASLGLYQGFFDRTVIGALEYFRAEYTWHNRGITQDDGSVVIESPKQGVNFINVGVTLIW